MAERPKGYGMTAELQAKTASKYDQRLAMEACDWICEITSVAKPPGVSSDDVHDWLKDGKLLCNLINCIQPSSVKKINESKMAFKMMENIGNFLDGCVAYGLTKTDIFQTVDLYEAVNIPQVINGIHALGRKVGAKNPSLPAIGPKESTEQKREFTEEQLQAGKGVIGLQMGSNKGASQAGMTPVGLGRQIEKTNLKV